MKKPRLVYLLIALVVISSVLTATLYFGVAQSLSLDVSGVISSDTTWTNINRPYNFTGNVFVNNGVTLTIEAGTTVCLNDHSLTINGTLDARGTPDNKINFVSTPTMWSNEGVIVFLGGSSNWNEQTKQAPPYNTRL